MLKRFLRSPEVCDVMSASEIKAKIFIVEDHPIVCDGYVLILEAEDGLQLCGFASTESEALDGLREHQPDLAIVDLMLEDGSGGVELIRRIRQLWPTIRVLVISGSDEQLFAERAIDAGATGYLSKRSATAQLTVAIRRVLNGEIVLSPPIADRVLKSRFGRANASSSPIDGLTNREMQVFRMIGEGRSTSGIADLLFLSPRTVERHRENIKRKLDLQNSTELIRHATTWNLENA